MHVTQLAGPFRPGKPRETWRLSRMETARLLRQSQVVSCKKQHRTRTCLSQNRVDHTHRRLVGYGPLRNARKLHNWQLVTAARCTATPAANRSPPGPPPTSSAQRPALHGLSACSPRRSTSRSPPVCWSLFHSSLHLLVAFASSHHQTASAAAYNKASKYGSTVRLRPTEHIDLQPPTARSPIFSPRTSQPHGFLRMLDESMTFKSTSTTGTASSKASSLFDLDEHGSKSILVYKYRTGASGLEVKTEGALCAELDKGELSTLPPVLPSPLSLLPADPGLPFIRVTRKPIPRGYSRLDILGEDLMMPEERERYSEKPTLKASVANVGLPKLAKWKHMILGSYEDLYIVSRSVTPTPESSKNNSPESSQHVSPATTFPSDANHALRNPDA